MHPSIDLGRRLAATALRAGGAGLACAVLIMLTASPSGGFALPGGEVLPAIVGPASVAEDLPPLAMEIGRAALEQGLAPAAAPAPPPATAGNFPVVIPTEPDGKGLGRDTAYLLGYQFLGFLVLYASPEEISNWSEEDKKNYDLGKWWHNVTNPSVDEDKWWINYVLHPYWGSAYFLDARGRGFGRWGSFWYSFFASCLYEFGTEAFAEEASIQDIFVTPIGGALLGMALESTWRDLALKGNARTAADSVLLYFIDPLGQLNHDVDHLFGYDQPRAALSVVPVIAPAPGRGAYTGIQVSLRW